MSRNTDKLETAHGEFNALYRKTREDIENSIDPDHPEPEAERVIETLDALDAVLDEIVTAIIELKKDQSP